MELTAVELRHLIHQNPELAFHEFETTNLIVENIEKMPGSRFLKLHKPMPTGLLVEYTGGKEDEEYLLFRADIDALPIFEQNDVGFRSKNNYMHACGHDIHTAILYSLIQKVLNKKLNKNILFLFQPAEESGGGAIKYNNSGIFENYNIKYAFALHVNDEFEEGTIASTPGVLFASSLELDIIFIGVSSHVAFPANGKNAFNALRMFMNEIEKLKATPDEPFIFGAGKITAGEVRNILPGRARIEATVRGLSMNKVNGYLADLKSILNHVKTETGVNYLIKKGAAYPEVIVDKRLFNLARTNLSDNYKFVDCGLKMTGEDFGLFSQKYPSFMFWLGSSTGKRYGLHNPNFLPQDGLIEKGRDIFLKILTAV